MSKFFVIINPESTASANNGSDMQLVGPFDDRVGADMWAEAYERITKHYAYVTTPAYPYLLEQRR